MFLAIVIPVLLATAAVAGDTVTLTGRISSLAGEPVADAELYLYASKNTRRPADFISPRTTAAGTYRIVLPPGTYWAVARVKKGARFGPLMPGDRHSGEPVKIVAEGEPEFSQDFTVADMQELAQKREKGREELVELRGSVTDSAGKGVADAYVYARTDRLTVTLPEHISAWTDESGKFRMRLPPGRYYLGTARRFPPAETPAVLREMELPAGKLPVAIDLQLSVE
jgi:hypothetical protein